MRQLDLKKLLLPNLPYLLIGLYATKLGEAWRLAPGADASAKLLGLMDGFAAAFQSALPSFHPVDLLVGLCCGAALRLAVYIKGKNAKKYRKNMEYGSARWFTMMRSPVLQFQLIQPLVKGLPGDADGCADAYAFEVPFLDQGIGG